MMLPIISQLNKAHPQGSICRALDISRSGLHHALLHRDRPVCDLQTETLIKAVFAENQQTYGSRRMRSELAKRGLALGRYKVRKLLNAFNLKPAGSVSLFTPRTANTRCRWRKTC